MKGWLHPQDRFGGGPQGLLHWPYLPLRYLLYGVRIFQAQIFRLLMSSPWKTAQIFPLNLEFQITHYLQKSN
jgi:hypothetical protein